MIVYILPSHGELCGCMCGAGGGLYLTGTQILLGSRMEGERPGENIWSPESNWGKDWKISRSW